MARVGRAETDCRQMAATARAAAAATASARAFCLPETKLQLGGLIWKSRYCYVMCSSSTILK